MATKPMLIDDGKDSCSLVIMRDTMDRISTEKKRDMAERSGIKCIKLEWNDWLDTEIGIMGFQSVEIRSTVGRDRKMRYEHSWSVDPFDNTPRDNGALTFIPDEMHVGIAYLPDSPFNRVALAASEVEGNAPWKIADENFAAEIRELGQKIKESAEYKEAQQRIIEIQTEVRVKEEEDRASSGDAGKLTPIELKNKILENKVKELEAEKRHRELQEKIDKLSGKKQEPAKVEAVEAPAPAQSVNEEKLRKIAREQIYAEKADLISEIKEAHKAKTGRLGGFAFSVDYRSKILPLIEQRIEELKSNEPVNSNTGIGD